MCFPAQPIDDTVRWFCQRDIRTQRAVECAIANLDHSSLLCQPPLENVPVSIKEKIKEPIFKILIQ